MSEDSPYSITGCERCKEWGRHQAGKAVKESGAYGGKEWCEKGWKWGDHVEETPGRVSIVFIFKGVLQTILHLDAPVSSSATSGPLKEPPPIPILSARLHIISSSTYYHLNY